jgi:hypothetical protein
MPNTTPVLVNNGWFPSGIPWAEYISNKSATTDSQFSYGAGNQTTMSILVNDADVEQAVADLLGSQEMDPNVHGQLNRVIPMTHPRFHWMFAERITGAHPIRFTDKRQGFGTSKYAAYAARVLTVLFTQPKYSIFSDAQLDLRYGAPRQEWRRFIEFVHQPASFLLSRETGSFTFTEGGGGTAPTANTTVVPGNQTQFLSQLDITAIWHKVPQAGLFDNGGTGRPTGLLSALNTVNSASFMGYPAGTLLFKAFRLQPLEDPVSPTAFGLNVNNGEASVVYDVELGFSYFDPPQGGTARGWNLAPWPNQLWYQFKDTNTLTKTLFNTTDFTTTIFQMQL